MTPLLSLVVPTFNRAALLAQSLRAILTQITPAMAQITPGLADGHQTVEVLVIDNASPDNTPAIVAQAQNDFPHVTLRSLRRPQNIGCDANFCDAPNQARGQWVYLLSDDDVLLPGAVTTLLRLIAEHPDVDAFALNVREFQGSPEEDTPGVFLISEDCLLKTRDEALVFLRSHITFLSCIAFRRASVAGRDYAPRYHTNLAQAYMFLDALAPGHGLYATRECFLARRADNNEGFDFFRVFVTNFCHLADHAKSLGYSRQAVQKLRFQHLSYVYVQMLVIKSEGAFGRIRIGYVQCLRAVFRLLRSYGLNRFVLLMIIPRLLLPGGIFVPVQRLYTRLKARMTGKPPAGRAGGTPHRA